MANRPLTRILYVEDEPDIRAIALMALETIGGFTVRACNSGQEAIDAAPEFAPDLVILDVMMPGMDGPATLAALRGQAAIADAPVVFMTAKVQSHEIAHYREIGALDVITKPFDPMELPGRVRSIWDSQPDDREQSAVQAT